jgi:hypothetical protein
VKYLDITLDRFPDPPTGDCKFIDCHDETGASVNAGEWVHHEDGTVSLRIKPSLFYAEVRKIIDEKLQAFDGWDVYGDGRADAALGGVEHFVGQLCEELK